MTDDLLPCPHCDAPAELDRCQGFRALVGGRLENAVAIYCTKCSAHMTICYSDHPEYDVDQLVAILTEDWNRRPARLRPVPEVKPLEWGETSYGRPEVETVVGVYRINDSVAGGWSVSVGRRMLHLDDGRVNFATQEQAKAAAQTDYERLVMSTLEVVPHHTDLVDKLRSLIDEQTEGDAVILVQRQLLGRVVGALAGLYRPAARR